VGSHASGCLGLAHGEERNGAERRGMGNGTWGKSIQSTGPTVKDRRPKTAQPRRNPGTITAPQWQEVTRTTGKRGKKRV